MLFSTCMMSYLPNLVVILATVLAGGEKHAVHVPVPVCIEFLGSLDLELLYMCLSLGMICILSFQRGQGQGGSPCFVLWPTCRSRSTCRHAVWALCNKI